MPQGASVILEVRGLVNRFGAQVVHDGLDMQVYAEDVFGIVGGSGAGKSVLLRSILGLEHPQAGTVSIGGRDLARLTDAQLRTVKADYGVTFQAGALYSSLTVLQNVQFPMIEHLQLPAQALDELAMLKIRLVGLPTEAADKYPAQLSGGMVKPSRGHWRLIRSSCSSMSPPRASTPSAPPPSMTWCTSCISGCGSPSS
jgi:phospholipid/cholesterol/gamma-HCH transport system ATP-binding protein